MAHHQREPKHLIPTTIHGRYHNTNGHPVIAASGKCCVRKMTRGILQIFWRLTLLMVVIRPRVLGLVGNRVEVRVDSLVRLNNAYRIRCRCWLPDALLQRGHLDRQSDIERSTGKRAPRVGLEPLQRLSVPARKLIQDRHSRASSLTNSIVEKGREEGT